MKIIALACASALTLAVAGCGGGSNSPTPTQPAPIPVAQTCGSLAGTAILNGADCTADEVARSAVVLLNMEGGGINQGACSGTLITRRAILTAAHCLDQGVSSVRVWLGIGDQIPAQSFVFFPGYVFNQNGFDVGVIFMADDLPRNPVPVLLSRDAAVGEDAIIAGWGRNQNAETARLRAGSTKISAVSGNGLLQTIFAPPSSSVCQGDSGGPILIQEGGVWSIAGITSATSGSVCNTGENFYQAVRHPSVSGFIDQHVPDAARK
jgi:hypothetical protein